MIAVDTNILVYAHRKDSQWFGSASAAVNKLAGSTYSWAIPWPCIHEFLAVVTNSRLFKPPTPLAVAIKQVELWLQSPSVRIIGEMQDHWKELVRVLEAGHIIGGGIHDARVAAICLEHGVKEFLTMDRDFGRMAGLPTVNPLLR